MHTILHTILAFLGAIGLKIGLALLEIHRHSSPAVLQIWEVLNKNWQIISFYAPLKHILLPPLPLIPAKFHDLSVMLTNLKDSHDLKIVF